jgi:SpoVK/Ycf46/Vps4 family AAA+-type ATPase
MVNSSQIKSLLMSYIDGNTARFFAVAMQIAAHEAKIGHSDVASDLKKLIDKGKGLQKRKNQISSPTPIFQPSGELEALLSTSFPKLNFSKMALPESLREKLDRILRELRNRQKLLKVGLSPRRKFLIMGPPGTGKTMTASALAGELKLPLFSIRLDAIMTKFMGEAGSKLRIVFEELKRNRGVYLFDEFDSIGSSRAMSNDVGEMRRTLNTLLQLIDEDDSESVILCATNYPELLDKALFRRFDDILNYSLPSKEERRIIINNVLSSFGLGTPKLKWEQVLECSDGLSQAELSRVCEDSLKEAVLSNLDKINTELLIKYLEEKKAFRSNHEWGAGNL